MSNLAAVCFVSVMLLVQPRSACSPGSVLVVMRKAVQSDVRAVGADETVSVDGTLHSTYLYFLE